MWYWGLKAGFTEHSRPLTAMKMLVVVGLTALAAYFVGWALGEALGITTCADK